jgi:hypothetical protein
MREILEKFPGILALLTVILLVMSVSHEYGYFWVVGSHFQTFLSTTDYLANGILWLPLGLIFIYGNVEWWRFKDQNKPPKDWKKLKTWIWPAIVFLGYASLFAFAEWPPNFLIGFSLLGVLVFVWSKIWRSLLPDLGIEEPFKSAIENIILVAPPAMAGMFIWGWVNASTDLISTSEPYVLSLVSEPSSHEMRTLLRTFDKGLLVRNPSSNRVEFYKWDDVASISKPVPDKSRSFICWAFEICPSDRKAKSPL